MNRLDQLIYRQERVQTAKLQQEEQTLYSLEDQAKNIRDVCVNSSPYVTSHLMFTISVCSFAFLCLDTQRECATLSSGEVCWRFLNLKKPRPKLIFHLLLTIIRVVCEKHKHLNHVHLVLFARRLFFFCEYLDYKNLHRVLTLYPWTKTEDIFSNQSRMKRWSTMRNLTRLVSYNPAANWRREMSRRY